MSLINKMLQDLDARHGGEAARQGGSPVVRPVASSERFGRPGLAMAAGVGVVVLALGGVLAWRYLFSKPPAAPVPQQPAVLAPATPAPVPQAAVAQQAPQPAAVEALKQEAAKPPRKADAQPARHAVTPAAEQPPRKPATSERPARKAAATEQAPAAAKTQAAEDVGTQQRGETLYRRGLAALQEGRVQEAITTLEQAVLYYPRHDAARQTLIGLLIENQRAEEAMRHLQFGIGLDPRQVNMAMLLARLQLERGGAAVETLQKSLPYAGSNAEYRAFLAGALQHSQRHREAAEQYQAALRLQPQNGVWWMGLGISLAADKRNAEARDAFVHARATGMLTPELQTFVERKLQQLN
ncbi:tetratricopeptide repeat protein [Massilia endophytica]|uniref:tetratricopeptide repeat protein n=1 Tax=Massilia endophytica TaxID=2899220 RepID=UPI001E35D3F6|nr:tetratricopeptide repeat protein [Massilia endophytica]UGQ48381.1 tetratricopeptide repeat protein [Massilia endophytica]